MRSPLLAFTVLAISTVTPTLSAPTPKSPNLSELNQSSAVLTRVVPRGLSNAALAPDIPGLPTGIPFMSDSDDDSDNEDEDEEHDSHDKDDHHHKKRAYDWGTAGGNAYTGATGNTGGGSIINHATNADGTITNAAGSS